MAEISIDTTAWDSLSDRLKKLLTENRAQLVEEVAEDVALYFDSIVRAELPPKPRPQPQGSHFTPKQRRWWWATMHAKAIGKSNALPGWKAAYRTIDGVQVLVLDGSYKRTGTGIRRLTYDLRRRGVDTQIHYGTDVGYMKHVIDEDNQSPYHQGNWETLQELARMHQDKLAKRGQKTLLRRLENL